MKLRLQSIQRLSGHMNESSHLEACIQIAVRTLEQVRDLGRELHPALLDDLGLIPALRSQVEQQAQVAGLIGHFSAVPLPARLDSNLELVCFRVAQEALTNVLRHAQAQRIWVEITRNENELEVRIRDDGIGFDTAATAAQPLAHSGSSMGLIFMQERAKLAGGSIEFKSTPMLGTEVRAVFPLTFAVVDEIVI